ncbi:MAG: exodeoxyribonuclease large subunit [Bryobacterales bacterium]|jgi:exodeoxyribonuclease VII large subunit|nr:exodeoxyribonuclease large subunit [Bryobacterales bacterium]
MEQFALSFDPEPLPEKITPKPPERRVFSLRELSDAIRGTLERSFTNIWLSGEISGCKPVPGGHCYFTLKDAEAQIKCVCWKLTYWRLRFKPKDGMQVLVRGRVDIYEQRSEYQFVIETIEPQGHGALQIAFDQLKTRLLGEGLFEAARKRQLPRYPRRIGIVTSPQGAVIRDFIQILSRRFPGLHVRLFPARVQGPGSIEDVRRGIGYFGETGWAQVIVIARGGGSLEDLWTFNEEAVARAIAESPVPVVSAIGHETDVTIADFVADLRAPTPSAAAELVVCTRQEVLDRVSSEQARMTQLIRYRMATLARRLHEQAIDRATTLLHRNIARRTQRVDDAEERLRSAIRNQVAAHERTRRALEEKLRYFDLRPRLRRDRERLSYASALAATLVKAGLHKSRRRFENLHAELNQLNPRLVLTRGYAIVLNDKGEIVKAAAEAPAGSDLKLLFAEDSLHARVLGSDAAE